MRTANISHVKAIHQAFEVFKPYFWKFIAKYLNAENEIVLSFEKLEKLINETLELGKSINYIDGEYIVKIQNAFKILNENINKWMKEDETKAENAPLPIIIYNVAVGMGNLQFTIPNGEYYGRPEDFK